MPKDTYLTENNNESKVQQWQLSLNIYKKRWKYFTLDNSALLVIDMQNYFLDEKSHAFVPSSKIVLKNTIKLVDFFRKHKKPVIFTYFGVLPDEDDPIKNWWHDSVKSGSEECKIAAELLSEKGKNDIIIRKSTYSSFYKTNLEDILRKNNIKNILIAGVLTNLCCETAVREAFVRSFTVFISIDAAAAYTEEMHLSALKNISYGFATPISTKEVKEAIK